MELPPDSPALDLPWIITFGPLTEAEEWEPVVCGPYERPHALALAEEIVADDQLMAVVEPLMAYVAPAEIRNDIALSRDVSNGGSEPGIAPLGSLASMDGAGPEVADPVEVERPTASDPPSALPLPTPTEVRAGMARVVRPLAD